MDLKEIGELRRRFRPDKDAISRIYGCYVNGNKEIVSYVDTPLGLLTEAEREMYLDLLRKALGGALRRNLIDIVFSTEQVREGDQHRLLMDLRKTGLEDREVREIFYQNVVGKLEMGESGYLLLLAHDQYDVPRRRSDGEDDESETVFSYILCAVCPIKEPGMALRYFHDANEFHGASTGQTVAPPALGFLFPAFDDRAANIYDALYFVRKPSEIHPEFIEAVFDTEPPMSAEEQRQAFHDVLVESLGEERTLDVLQTIHEQIRERIGQNKAERDPEPPVLAPGDVRKMLGRAGVSEERLAAFDRAVSDRFGEGAVLDPVNVIDSRRFEIEAPDVRISVDPASSYVVEARIIDGRKYLLIPAGHDVTVNGVPVSETVEGPVDLASASAAAVPSEDDDTPPW